MLLNNLREARTSHDLTQEELAKMVGVRRETILYLEKGTYNPSLELAFKVANALEKKIDDIFQYVSRG